MSRPRTLRLILGDQLNELHSWFRTPDENTCYVMMEILQEARYVLHHIQKLAAFFAAMRSFARRVQELGHRLIYIRLDDPENRQTFEGNVARLLSIHGFERFEYLWPDEYRLDVQLRELEERLSVPSQGYDTEHFLSGKSEVKEFFKDKQRFLMEPYYRFMRKRHDILMEDARPTGGRWNFDQSNRQRYDHGVPIPEPLLFQNDVTDIVEMIERMEVATFGSIDPGNLVWPLTRTQALELLGDFLERGLPHFGTYQDAMTEGSWCLFHSRLSFPLNTKMLHPLEVINVALRAADQRKEHVKINQVEGFVRQILGWREYVRGVYWALMPEFASMNFFSHTAQLPHYYWNAHTRMNCMRAAIKQSLEHAYAHHIQRLMVTGNFALLAGVHPDAVGAWYLGVYIDAIEWVELPNTRGMSQFADGGVLASKPYASSARYIHSMSDYCSGCHYKHAGRHGERACPFNCLYWDFLIRHRPLLQGNPRVAMMYRAWNTIPDAEKDHILKQAGLYKQHLDGL
jgi:deoxyribodipyrimidine photolyase-related protein